MSEGEKLIPINIEEAMKSAYIDYSMSVIVSRALPDVRDGLKPVHRRVLYGMHQLGLRGSSKFKKSAFIVGEVLGKYHPHGDSSVYDTMVRMAQEWSLRYLMVDGQGNYGSVDGDSPAAMRYTEARMQKISEEMVADLDKDTVDHQLNYDDSIMEPTVLPTKIPNLLVNGASGIAVGMATNMPPHNLTEVIDGTVAYIENNDIEIEELIQFVKAPDFPTGGIIYGYDGVKQAFETGRGRVVMRAKAEIEEVAGRECIIVTEIPYQVNKAEMIRKTAEMINDKKIEGISTIRDESDRKGMRIVYVLKRDSVPNVVLNTLFKHTQLQSSFSVNNIALVKGRPQLLNLKQMIGHFVDHRHEVVVRRTKFELKKAEERAHILEGLIIASDNIDKVISLIRSSSNADEAKSKLISEFKLSEIQSKAIVEMRLRQLTGLEQDKLRGEFDDLMKTIKDLKDILDSESRRMDIIKTELLEMKEKYGDERRSEIEYAGGDLSMEDMIPNEKVVITISNAGYIKRTPLVEYKTQNRGGVGQRGSTTRNEDFLEHLFVGTNHQYMLFFTQKGKCFWMRVFEIPEGSKTSKGRAMQNLINIEQDDEVKAFICTQDLKDEDYINSHYVIMATKKGQVKKTSLEQYSRPRSNGINAITIKDNDELLEAKLTTGNSQVLIAVKSGKCIRFEESKTRPMGRNASGVRGIRLKDDSDEVVGMISVNDMDSDILVVSENGYGKRSSLEDYRMTNRGGKGVKTISITDKTGQLVTIKNVCDGDDLMIINKSGIAIRMEVSSLRVMGRATQGVKLINLKENDSIAAVAKVVNDDENVSDLDEIDVVETKEEKTKTNINNLIMRHILYTLILISSISYGQKKELKQAQKLIDQEFYSEALNLLNTSKDFILSSDKKYHAQYYFLNGWALKENSDYLASVNSLKKSMEIERSLRQKKYIENANILMQQAEADLVNSAVEDNKNGNFKSASVKLYDAYLMNPEKDDNINYLYFSASSAVNSKEYDTALEYYAILKDMGYTGVVSEYFVTPLETNIEEKVSETEYNLFKNSKDYTNQRVGKTESRLPEIVKNIALIYVQKGEVDLAISAIKEARAINPDDVNLLLSEADLYIKLGDREKFKELMKLAVQKDPDNAILYYNLGVINGEQGEFDEAKKFYLKSLELDPSYTATYLNLVGLILEGEGPIVEEMNKLVTSRKASDLDKYDQLEEKELDFTKNVYLTLKN